MKNNVENTIIIGGGVAGLSAGIYLARAGLKPLIIAGSPAGGQLVLTSEVENYPGIKAILGPELIAKMRDQAQSFGARIIDENVQTVKLDKSPFNVGASHALPVQQTKSVIIATGAKAIWLGVPGEDQLRGKGVSACATCDGFFFKNKIVGVVGGGDTAMEEALTLTRFASKIYIIHRRGEFRASKIMQERVFKHPKIEVMWNAVVEEVMGEKKVEGIRLNFQLPISSYQSSSNSSMINENLKLDGLFVAIGHKPDTDLFKGHIELDKKGYVITTARAALINFQLPISSYQSSSKSQLSIQNDNLSNENSLKNAKLKIENYDISYQTSTSVNGVFAAGDCVDYVYRQAATAAGMGVAGALDVEKYLEGLR